VSAFVDERRADFGVELICQTLGVSASAYYQRKTGQRSARAVEDERLLAVIERTHTANYEAYGSRRMWKALRRQGETAPRCQVERLMAANAIVGAKRRGRPWRTTLQGAETVASPDLLDRDFSAERPDEKWCADFTYIRCWEGVVFFSFVIDCYSRMVVGWQFATHMRTSLVQDALDMAVGQRRPDPDALLIHHSDRGSQYTSAQFNDALDDHGVLASLGSTGDAYDTQSRMPILDAVGWV
jgi:putative transposase